VVVDVVLDVVEVVLDEVLVVVVVGEQFETNVQNWFNSPGLFNITFKIAVARLVGQSLLSIFCKTVVKESHVFTPVQGRFPPL
jgi:hypothetical protein